MFNTIGGEGEPKSYFIVSQIVYFRLDQLKKEILSKY